MKDLPKIELNFRGCKISKTLDTVKQFTDCLAFLYREEEQIPIEIVLSINDIIKSEEK